MTILGVYVPGYVLIVGLIVVLFAAMAVYQETQRWR